MGTWISHIRIAENLLGHIGGLEPEAFLYGSLAPDSGIPNADWSAFDPPKTVTHFLNPGADEGEIRDLVFYQTYIAECAQDLDAAAYGFRFGYFFHLVCDNLWALRFQPRYSLDYAAEFAEDKNFIWKIKTDWYALDHRYLRDYPDSAFWQVLLPGNNPASSLPFLPEAALHRQLDYIKNFYANERPANLDRPYPYLNQATMDRFVADATLSLTKIYDILVTQPDLANASSAVFWLEADERNAYPAPVGDRGRELA